MYVSKQRGAADIKRIRQFPSNTGLVACVYFYTFYEIVGNQRAPDYKHTTLPNDSRRGLTPNDGLIVQWPPFAQGTENLFNTQFMTRDTLEICLIIEIDYKYFSVALIIFHGFAREPERY